MKRLLLALLMIGPCSQVYAQFPSNLTGIVSGPSLTEREYDLAVELGSEFYWQRVDGPALGAGTRKYVFAFASGIADPELEEVGIVFKLYSHTGPFPISQFLVPTLGTEVAHLGEYTLNHEGVLPNEDSGIDAGWAMQVAVPEVAAPEAFFLLLGLLSLKRSAIRWAGWC